MNPFASRLAFLALIALMALSAPLLNAPPSYASSGVTVELSQYSGPIGTVVTVKGKLANPGAEFKVFWHYIRDWDGRFGLLASGFAEGFDYEVNITIPPAARGTYYVIVEDEKTHVTGYALFEVTPEITLKPSKAPGGALVTVRGYLINGEVIDVAFYDPSTGEELLVASNATDPVTGEFYCRFSVPMKPEGNYLVRAYWKGQLQAEAPFQLAYAELEAASDATMPSEAIAGFSNVTVTGRDFIANEPVAVYLRSPSERLIATVTADEEGAFSLWFIVPSDVEAGVHEVVARQDEYNVYASAEIVVHKVVIINRYSVYGYGDLVSFYVNSSTPLIDEITIVVRDPMGIPFASLTIYGGNLAPVGDSWVAPYSASTIALPIPKGALYGVWVWNATFHSGLYPGVEFNASGAFLVAPQTDISYLISKLDQIDAKLSGVAQKQDQLYLLIETKHNLLVAKLEEVGGTLATIMSNGFAQINTVLGNVVLRLDNLDAKVVRVADDVAIIRTSMGELTANVSALRSLLSELKAKIVEVTDGVARIQVGLGNITADLEALNATLIEVKNGVAIVNTSIGNLTAEIRALNATLSKLSNVSAFSDGNATISTVLGNITVKLDELNARVVGVRDGVALLNTSMGEVMASLSSIGAGLTSLIINSKGEVVAELKTAFGSVNATLTDLGAKVVALQGNVMTLIVPGLGEVKAKVASAEDAFNRAAQATSNLGLLMYAVVAMTLATAVLSAFTYLSVRRFQVAP